MRRSIVTLLLWLSITGTMGAMPNPSAVYCILQGHEFQVRTDDQGNQYGVCVFPDGSECSAWHYYCKCEPNGIACWSDDFSCHWPCKQMRCKEAGESVLVSKCCEGLDEIYPAHILDAKCNRLELIGWSFLCSDCGNGICESWESKCNCPEDCAQPGIIYVDALNGDDNNDGRTPETAYATIQRAVDAAQKGDTVVAASGTYRGEGNRDIDFRGKAITLRSENGPENCIIDCNGTEAERHCGFYFHHGEDANSVVEGFAITNGHAFVEPDYHNWSLGGGIYCIGSGPSIRNCIITGNSATQGGGVFAWKNSSPKIINCSVRGNLGRGGIYCWENTIATITGCIIRGNAGRGIYCRDSSANIVSCIISNNEDVGVDCSASGPLTISNCSIIDNDGQGILCMVKGGAEAVISNCIISGNNSRATPGGGIRVFTYEDGSTKIANCTITGNSAVSRFGRVARGGGISCTSTGDTVITNSIVRNNLGGDLYLCNFVMPPNGDWTTEPTELAISYSCPGVIFVQEDPIFGDPVLTWGDGNFDADPCFVKAGYWDPNGTLSSRHDDFWVEGDYHLKSQAGRWDPATESWVIDDVTSPCIDTGDPISPIGREPFPNGGIINMGAYGGTPEASKSYFGAPICETIIASDINGDCEIDFADFQLIALHWLEDHGP